MSAYNGEKYIEEQIQSLINNKKDDMQLSLLVRDDGSSDNTVSIVKKMQKQNLIDIDLLEESNIGVTKRFLKLMNIGLRTIRYSYRIATRYGVMSIIYKALGAKSIRGEHIKGSPLIISIPPSPGFSISL